jgi:TPR repeat protein
MIFNRFPKPPETDNPIVLLRGMSMHRELEFLDEFLTAHSNSDVDRAARCALSALATPMERKLVDSLVSTVNNLAHATGHYSPVVTQLLCEAADRGYHQHAYNAANQLASLARMPRDFQVAERYYKIAMGFSENPALQAAAHVNYCPIIRDGLISGKPDWPAAVEIYETAARMGLVKGMFNAGNVSDWLAMSGERAYGARADYWFKYALDYRASGRPMLDMETDAELDEVFLTSMLALSGLHIDDRFDGADLEEGIRWAKASIKDGDVSARHNLGIGYTRRLERMTTKPHHLPGANWGAVLAQMDWSFVGEIETTTRTLHTETGARVNVRVDRLTVQLGDRKTVPLYVAHDPCLPCFGGDDVLQLIGDNLVSNGAPDGFFLLPRKALFREYKTNPFTPILVYHKNEFSLQALGMASSPDLVLQWAAEKVGFLDQRLPTMTCMIPIAVNALDEGYIVADNTTLAQPWVDVGGGWRMPFVSASNLEDLGIALRR